MISHSNRAARGDYAAAESMFRQVLETHRKAHGDRHPILATTLNNLSRGCCAEATRRGGCSASGRAGDRRAALGSEHQLVAIHTINLASLHLTRKATRSGRGAAARGPANPSLSPELVPSRRRTFLEDD
jgi:hypothetical protein